MHKPYDREQVTKIIADIERYTKDLHELGISGRDDLEDRRNLYALSMLLFSIINRTIDLADEVVQARIQEEMLARHASAFPFAKIDDDFIVGYNPEAYARLLDLE